jgi:putative transposase
MGAPVSCGMVRARPERLRPASDRSRSRATSRDRGAAGDGERIRFNSAILPLWARRTRSLDALLPVLYLRGISTGDFQEALTALLGKDAPNLSPAVISRLTAEWQGEYERWQKRDLSARRYVYVWADGVFLQARMEDHGECMLVLIGATPEGKKELIGFQVGVRESTQSWRELVIDVKQHGLQIAPEIAVGDGALGFWKALDEVCPGTRHQRCWVHKTVNILDKVPLSGAGQHEEGPARSLLGAEPGGRRSGGRRLRREISGHVGPSGRMPRQGPQRAAGLLRLPCRALGSLAHDQPIESVFVTVRHRTVRTKGSPSSTTARLMVFKLVIAASKTWRRLKGTNQLPN